ncbi:MAG: FliO/MopB family protein [Chlamydiales bacterium]
MCRFLALLADDTLLLDNIVEGKSYNYWGEFVNMIITLIVIIGLIFLSVIVLKKIMRSKIQQVNRTTAIKILERRSLGQKSALYLVDILGKGVVISESPAGINLITEFGKENDVVEMLDKRYQDAMPTTSFKERLISKLKKKNA